MENFNPYNKIKKMRNYLSDKIEKAKEKKDKLQRFGSGNVTPENSSIEEVVEFKNQEKNLEDYEKSFEDNKAA